MNIDYIKARNAMFGLVKSTAATFNPVPRIEYPMQVSVGKPDASKIWLRAATQIVTERQTALSTCVGDVGKKTYTSYGLLIIEFYIPKKEPNGVTALMWATTIRNAFRNASSSDGVIYRKATVNDNLPDEENFFRINVVVQFEFDEIK